MLYSKKHISHITSKTTAFTLLEVLVVLVLIGLLSTLLLQGFSYTLTLRGKILKQLGRVQNQEVVESWFRNTTSNLILKDKYPEEPLSFKGSPLVIKGDTIFSLNNAPGMLQPAEWRLQNDDDGYTRLFYSSNYQPTYTQSNSPRSDNESNQLDWMVAEWFQVDAAFSYLDKNGNWHENWPNKQYPDELPVGIMLNISREIQPFFWYSRLKMEKKVRLINRLTG